MFFDDFTVGRRFSIPPVTIAKEMMLSFAEIYDPLPFHLDEDFAEKSRFKGLIAPGVMSFMSVWAEFVRTGILRDGLIAGKSTKIEWFAPVYAGDVLTGHAVVSEAYREKMTSGNVTIVLDIHNQHGVMVIRDTTEVVVRARS